MNRTGSVESTAVPAATVRGVPRAFHPWWSPVWVAFVVFQWWVEIRRQLMDAVAAEAPPLHADVAAALGAAGHLAGNAVEALFYVGFWRARGIRLSFRRLFEWLVSFSVLDLLASGLTRFAESHPGWVEPALEVFVGLGALHREDPGLDSGLRAAFGSVGLLCIARLAATAEIQRRGTEGRFASPLALTFGVWLLGRLSNWWLLDLARGMSPLP